MRRVPRLIMNSAPRLAAATPPPLSTPVRPPSAPLVKPPSFRSLVSSDIVAALQSIDVHEPNALQVTSHAGHSRSRTRHSRCVGSAVAGPWAASAAAGRGHALLCADGIRQDAAVPAAHPAPALRAAALARAAHSDEPQVRRLQAEEAQARPHPKDGAALGAGRAGARALARARAADRARGALAGRGAAGPARRSRLLPDERRRVHAAARAAAGRRGAAGGGDAGAAPLPHGRGQPEPARGAGARGGRGGRAAMPTGRTTGGRGAAGALEAGGGVGPCTRHVHAPCTPCAHAMHTPCTRHATRCSRRYTYHGRCLRRRGGRRVTRRRGCRPSSPRRQSRRRMRPS